MAEETQADKLTKASASGNLLEVCSLLQRGADVDGLNSYNRTALQVAMLGHTNIFETLLDAGANPNMTDPCLNITVIQDAAREGFIDTVRVLLDHGADPNLADALGNLPLHLAASEGHVEVTKLLLERTDDPRATNNARHTASELAGLRGKLNVVSCIEEYFNGH